MHYRIELSLKAIAFSNVVWINGKFLMLVFAGTNPENFSCPVGKITSIHGDVVKVRCHKDDMEYLQIQFPVVEPCPF